MITMNRKQYRQIRVFVALFVSFVVSQAVVRDSYLLAAAGVVTGMVFLGVARAKTNIVTDERDAIIREKAARMAYGIFTPTLGLAAFFLMLPTKGGLSVFSKGEWAFIEALGSIFAYLTLFLIALYAISYHYFNRKYGGGGDEE